MTQTFTEEETLAALKASIKHWQENLEAPTPFHARLGTYACPLCALFFADLCAGCPVQNFSKYPRCIGTLYEIAADAFLEWRDSWGTNSAELMEEVTANWQKAAKAELDFLKSLRPENAE